MERFEILTAQAVLLERAEGDIELRKVPVDHGKILLFALYLGRLHKDEQLAPVAAFEAEDRSQGGVLLQKFPLVFSLVKLGYFSPFLEEPALRVVFTCQTYLMHFLSLADLTERVLHES